MIGSPVACCATRAVFALIFSLLRAAMRGALTLEHIALRTVSDRATSGACSCCSYSMALTPTQHEEVQAMIKALPCREHEGDLTNAIGALEQAQAEMVGYRAAVETLTKVAERLSLVVVGDAELRIPGVGKRLEEEARERRILQERVELRWDKDDKRITADKIRMAKTIGFILGAAAVLNILLRVAAHILTVLGIAP